VWRPRHAESEERASAKNAAADLETLHALEKAGADLSKPTDIEFYLYFQTQEAAERARDTAQMPGFSAVAKQAGKGKSWLCLLSGRMAPTEDEIRAASALLQELADSLGGEYDGWEAKVTR
jgi:hypothetical protein